MRTKKAFLNIITSVAFQILNILFGIVIPRYIIFQYGSEVNGLVNSIVQFLSYISLAEAGINGVIHAAYYKALAKNDDKELSIIAKTSQSFFNKIGYTFIVYIILLIFVYPYFVRESFSTGYVVLLLLMIAISTFTRYFIGLAYRLLIQADQKLYIVNIFEIVVITLNFALTIILIKLNMLIHIVKLATAVSYSLSSVFYYIYIKKKYNLTKDCEVNNEIIKDRWSAFGHHIAATIHFNTDVVMLTLFTNVKEVSVYSVYAMIISGIRTLIANIPNALAATFGNMIANNEGENLKEKYTIFDYLNLLIVAIFYVSTAILITPFIKLYTSGITDTNYIRPVFAVLIILAEALYNIQYSYNMIVFSAGHFKQTKRDSYLEAGINVVVSLLLVERLGLVGVAIGTVCGMFWRTITYAIYLSKNIINWRILDVFIRYIVVAISTLSAYFIIQNYVLVDITNYISWIIQAVITTVLATCIILIINIMFLRKSMIKIYLTYIKPLLSVLVK